MGEGDAHDLEDLHALYGRSRIEYAETHTFRAQRRPKRPLDADRFIIAVDSLQMPSPINQRGCEPVDGGPGEQRVGYHGQPFLGRAVALDASGSA
jgi:hypothetical protein